jgi:hypothetical protein
MSKILAVIVAIGLAIWVWLRTSMKADATTQEFRNVPESKVDKDAFKPDPVEAAIYKADPETWVEGKIKEIEATGTLVLPTPTVKAAIIERNRARLAPETINWQAVATARAIEHGPDADSVVALQQAIDQRASPEVLGVVARTYRTDIETIRRQIDTGIPPKPPQAIVDAMIAKGDPLPAWYTEHYM